MLCTSTQGITTVVLQAIIQSFPMGVALKGKSDSLSLGRRFSKQVGCGDDSAASLACMRAKVPYSLLLHARLHGH